MLFQSIAPIEGTDWYLLINERGEEVHAPASSRLVKRCFEGNEEQEVLTLDGPVKVIGRANPLELAMYSAAGRLQEIEKAIADLQALKDAGLTTAAENATLERLEKIKAQLEAEPRKTNLERAIEENGKTSVHPDIKKFVHDELIEGETFDAGYARLEADWDRLQQKKLYGSASDEEKKEYSRLQAGLLKG